MAETIVDGRWHWYNVACDLRTQGRLEGVSIEPTSVKEHGCGGTTNSGTRFFITWAGGQFLLLSMDNDEPALVEAFAAVVEYRPFCRYRSKESGLLTYEWDKNDAQGRLQALQEQGEAELQEVA